MDKDKVWGILGYILGAVIGYLILILTEIKVG